MVDEPNKCPTCGNENRPGRKICWHCLDQLPDREAEAREAQRIARAKAKQDREIAREQAEKQRLVALYNTNTGKGQCPNCKSTNIREVAARSGGFDARGPACCIGCLFFLPLALLSPFLKSNPVKHYFHQCNYCGAKWSF